ncbi:MAG: tyrosine-type recombinase/integrase [Bacteroidota bacterium]
MIVQQHKTKFLDADSQDLLLKRVYKKSKHLRNKMLILLMMRCGLRVTETLILKWTDFDFQNKFVTAATLKQRGMDKKVKPTRVVYLENDVMECLGEYWKMMNPDSQDELLFPSKADPKKPITRQTVNAMLKILGKDLHPHVLRHTFAMNQLATGSSILEVQKMLGHKSFQTTEIYTHVSTENIKKAIQRTEVSRLTKIQRWTRKITKSKSVDLLPMAQGMTNFHVGRKNEISQLHDLIEKKVNILIVAEQGMGKTHLMDNLGIEKCLRLDEFGTVKKTLQAMLLELYTGDKRAIMELMINGKSFQQYLSKENVKALVEMLIHVTGEGEYTIMIDDVTRISLTAIRALEKLKNHFHVICGARRVKIDKSSFLSNFQKIELKELNRAETTQLIDLASADYQTRIEDYELYKTSIWNSTGGNPLFVIEMINRFRKEAHVSNEIVNGIAHTTAKKPIDLTLFFVVALSSLMVMRYVGGEIGSDAGAYKLIGGAAFVFAIFARYFYAFGKRKYI